MAENLRYYARYPFLEGAASILKDRKISMDDLLTDILYEPARTRGKERIQQAIDTGKVSSMPMPKEVDRLTEILSYPIARMVISCSGNRFLIARYALGEAMLLESRLLDESSENIVNISKELDIDVIGKGKDFLIHFSSFLSATSSIRAKEWKLVNQEIFKGMVKTSKERMARILRQKINDQINSDLPKPVNEKILEAFADDAGLFASKFEGKRKEFEPGELGPIDDASFPPCMKTILTMMRNGENVPHMARFAMVSFLHTLGMDAQKIMELFSTAPDFDPSKSEYQVRHISGEIGGTEYTPPECSTMKSYGICYNPDTLCEKEWMSHPLKYYRSMKKRRASRGFKPSPDPSKSLDDGDTRKDDEEDEHDVENPDGETSEIEE